MALSVCFDCQQTSALSNMMRKQTPGVLTDRRKTFCSRHNDPFRREVKRKIAVPLGMRSGEWGGEQFNYGEDGARGQGHKWRPRKKEGMMSFFTGTVTEMKSGHTQRSCSLPGTISVTGDYSVVTLLRKTLRPYSH